MKIYESRIKLSIQTAEATVSELNISVNTIESNL